MTLIPNWQNQDLTCALCGSKRSVKYKLKIFILDNLPSDTKTEEEVCACNRCALTLTTPIESSMSMEVRG
jgi:hypothetical protein